MPNGLYSGVIDEVFVEFPPDVSAVGEVGVTA